MLRPSRRYFRPTGAETGKIADFFAGEATSEVDVVGVDERLVYREAAAQATSARATEQGLLRDRFQRVLGQLELDVVQLEHALVLLHHRVLGLDEDADEGLAVKVRHRADDRKPADELGDQAELEQILGLAMLENFAGLAVLWSGDMGAA